MREITHIANRQLSKTYMVVLLWTSKTLFCGCDSSKKTTSCENKPKEPQTCISWSYNMIVRMDQMVMGAAEKIIFTVSILVGSVHIILNEDLEIREIFSRCVPRMMIDDRCNRDTWWQHERCFNFINWHIESTPKKFRGFASVEKMMLAIIYNR